MTLSFFFFAIYTRHIMKKIASSSGRAVDISLQVMGSNPMRSFFFFCATSTTPIVTRQMFI